MALAPEPEDRRAPPPSASARYGSGAIPIATCDEERPRDAQVEAVAERAEDVDRAHRPPARTARAFPCRSGSMRKSSSPGGAWHRLIGRGEHAAGHLEHEELTGLSRVDAAALEPEERVGAERLAAEDGQALAPGVHASIPMRS